MDLNLNEKLNSYENILGDLDKKILNYQQTINQFPNKDNTKIINIDKLVENNEIEDKSFFDLISKYQLDNSNLQYENFYLKTQNKYLEDEIKTLNKKNEKIKKKLEEFNNKLENVELNKEKNLKDLNNKYTNYFNEIQGEDNKDILPLRKIQKSMNNFIQKNKELFQNFGIDLNLNLNSNNNIIDFNVLEYLINKLIDENKKLNKKIKKLHSFINDFNSKSNINNINNQINYNKYNNNINNINNIQEIKNIDKKNNINIIPSKLITLSPSKDNIILSERISKIINIPKLNYNQIKPNNNNFILKNKKILSNIDNEIGNNIEKNINFNLNKISNENKVNKNQKNILPKNLLNQINENGDNPLFGLKSKIEMLENLLKDVNVSYSQNDLNSETVSYYTCNPTRNINSEY